MAKTRSLFLETTAAADRIFGLPETRQALAEICGDNPLLSSSYVWDEFRRTFLRDAVVCHTILLNSLVREETLRDGLQRVRRSPELQFRPRRKERAWDVIAYLNDPPITSLEDAVDRLEKDIRYNLRRFFFAGLEQPLLNASDCRMTEGNARSIPARLTGGYARFELKSTCSKSSPPPCSIVTFWESNLDALETVAKMSIPGRAAKRTRQELERVREEAAKVVDAFQNDPKECYGERCYAVLADLVIALECPRDIPIVTQNDRHFGPLCQALSRPEPIGYR